MSRLKFKVLGGLEVADGCGKPLTRKSKAVAAFLALQRGQPQSRERLADLFWETSPEEQARTNLRQCLSTLRKYLGQVLVTRQDQISLDLSAIDLDTERFEQLVSGDDLEQLEQAAALYKGDLLAGFNIKEEAFETWIKPERERYRNLMVEGLVKMISHYEASQNTGAMAKSATRLLALDPLSERAHRTLMRTYAAQGRHGAALKQFEACCNILKCELGVEPEPETVALSRDIRRRRANVPDEAVEAVPSLETEVQSLPDGPSVAVMPFVNMSADPEQEFFSDGITEDIITALSKVPSLLVIARSSTFTYKGRSVDAKQVSSEQGVRYVLEGSVRKANNRVRVTAQLIDATTGHHLWAERYDRDLEDIFAVQDDIAREVVVALDVQLREGEQARIWSGGTNNVEAWECVRLGMDALNRVTSEDFVEARRLLERAVELDPNYPIAWVSLGWVYFHEADIWIRNAGADRDNALKSAEACAPKALELDPSCADAYALLGLCHLSRGDHDGAMAMSEKSIALAPTHAENIAIAAAILNKSGRPERSLELIKRAMRLCPIYPAWYLHIMATAYRLLHQNESAINAFREGINRNRDNLALHVGLASTLGELGRVKDAQKSIPEILRLVPDFSIKRYMEELSYKDLTELARFEDGLRKAGLSE